MFPKKGRGPKAGKRKRTTREKEKKPKKTPGIVKGSTADYKRKEANRLAAERSRSRVAEKKTALNEAFAKLNEENEHLRAELARLEGGQDGTPGSGDRAQSQTHHELVEAVFQQQQQEQDQQHQDRKQGQGEGEEQMKAESGAAAAAGADTGAGEAAHGTVDAEAEAQAHSRTILAALMSDAEINEALGDNWMDHVSEADIVAATAEVHREQAATGSPHVGQTRSPSASADLPTVSPLPAGDTSSGSTSTPHARSVGLAIALHAEMERHLRDDLAATKVAIDQIERQLGAIRAGEDTTATTFASPLPSDYKAEDATTLKALLSTLGHDAQATSDRMGPLKDTVAELIDSRMTEASKMLAALAAVHVDGDDEAVVGKILQPLKTHLTELVNNLLPEVCSSHIIVRSESGADVIQHTDSFSALPGSRLAPSIAPRRRGRPTQTHPALRIKAVKGIKGRPPKKSKLANQVDLENGTEAEATTEADAGVEAAVAAVETDESALDTREPTGPQTESHAQEDQAGAAHAHPHAHADQPELTTEEIISQLTHDEQDLHDLLRSHAEAEFDAQQQAAAGLGLPMPLPLSGQFAEGQGEGSSSAAGHLVDPALQGEGEGDPETTGAGGGEGDGDGHGDAPPPNFPRGPGSCDICGRTQTTVWRKLRLPDHDLHVCNRESLYTHSLGGRSFQRSLSLTAWG